MAKNFLNSLSPRYHRIIPNQKQQFIVRVSAAIIFEFLIYNFEIRSYTYIHQKSLAKHQMVFELFLKK